MNDASNDYLLKRQHLVAHHLRRRGIQEEAILNSFLTVPRHVFVSSRLQDIAYEDIPLPIGEEQTISQPFVVAYMATLALLNKDSRVLEIGTGSGYAAAILSRIAAQVYTVERLERLAQQAQQRFQELSYTNIELKIGDGSLGWSEQAPFHAIIVSAAAPIMPDALFKQLAIQGRLIIPIGNRLTQELRCYTKISEDQWTSETKEIVRFVPLIGEQGWGIS